MGVVEQAEAQALLVAPEQSAATAARASSPSTGGLVPSVLLDPLVQAAVLQAPQVQVDL